MYILDNLRSLRASFYFACSCIYYLLYKDKKILNQVKYNLVTFQFRGLDVYSIAVSAFLIQSLRHYTERSMIYREMPWYKYYGHKLLIF